MDKKSSKNLIIIGIIAGVLLIGGMIYSLATYKYDPSVADNGNDDSYSAEVDGQDEGEVNTSAVQ